MYVIPLVCGSRAMQRNVTYYLDEVCKLHIGGNMSKEDLKPYLKKHGSSMKDATNEWLSISVSSKRLSCQYGNTSKHATGSRGERYLNTATNLDSLCSGLVLVMYTAPKMFMVENMKI